MIITFGDNFHHVFSIDTIVLYPLLKMKMTLIAIETFIAIETLI